MRPFWTAGELIGLMSLVPLGVATLTGLTIIASDAPPPPALVGLHGGLVFSAITTFSIAIGLWTLDLISAQIAWLVRGY
jgi:hypothetical protein